MNVQTPQPQTRSGRPIFLVGFLVIATGLFASAVLVSNAVGLVNTVPGCGVGGGCDELTNGIWGRLPVLDLPVSFLGMAWFLMMAVFWAANRQGRSLIWVARLSLLYSIFSFILMIALRTFCPWCAVAQGANIALWVLLERRNRGCGDRLLGQLVVVMIGVSAIALGLFLLERSVSSARTLVEADLLILRMF